MKENISYSSDGKILALLDRINAVPVNGKPVREALIFGQYNVWHFFQQRLYYEVKAFLEGTSSPASTPSFTTRCKEKFLRLIALKMTLLAACSLWFKKRTVLLYSADKDSSALAHNDFRINELYALLKRHSISYLETFYAIMSRPFITNLLARKRLAIYPKGLDVLCSINEFSKKPALARIDESALASFSDREKMFVRQTISNYWKTISRVEFRIRFLKAVYARSGAKLFLTIDSARDYHEAILAGHLAHIPTYAFQHGFYTSAFVGWRKGTGFAGTVVAPDRLYVWSDYWKQVLVGLDSVFPDIRIGGFSTLPPQYPMPDAHDGIVVLVPYEAQASHAEVTAFIKTLLSHADVTIIFKTRPDRGVEEQLAPYGFTASPRFIVESNTAKAMAKSDVVLGTYSTFLYDAVMSSRPVIVLETKIEWGADMVRLGLATGVKKSDDLREKLIEASKLSQAERTARRTRLCGTCDQLLRATLEKIAQEHKLAD